MRTMPPADLMNAAQVHAYLGGNIGIHKVRKLLQNNEIESIELGGNRELLTRKKFVDRWIELRFSRPMTGTVESFPNAQIKNPKKAG